MQHKVISLLMLLIITACSQVYSKEQSEYEKCVAAGGAVLKTDPPQCLTADGKRVVKK